MFSAEARHKAAAPLDERSGRRASVLDASSALHAGGGTGAAPAEEPDVTAILEPQMRCRSRDSSSAGRPMNR